MIVSASRRTDIPAFYAAWFLRRIREGCVLVPNPFNAKSVSRIALTRDAVDCIVFWTKNPAPMLPLLDGLAGHTYYFQYTLNPYFRDVEPGLEPLAKRIETFKRLSDRIGRERVVWRYDPILVGEGCTAAFHRERFAFLADALRDHTERCMLGFLDLYPHVRKPLAAKGLAPLAADEVLPFARAFRQAVEGTGIELATCTGKIDLSAEGIPAGKCIDARLVERLAGYPIAARRDPGQRDVCNCIESVDIGIYRSCPHGCVYCYALRGDAAAARAARQRHDPASPLMIGRLSDLPADTIIRDRPMRSLRRDEPFMDFGE